MAASGMVMRKTEPHQKCSSSQPAASGASTMTPPPMADHFAMAEVRAGPSAHSAVISANVVG